MEDNIPSRLGTGSRGQLHRACEHSGRRPRCDPGGLGVLARPAPAGASSVTPSGPPRRLCLHPGPGALPHLADRVHDAHRRLEPGRSVDLGGLRGAAAARSDDQDRHAVGHRLAWPRPRHRDQARPTRRGLRPHLQRAGRGDRPDDRRGVRPPARARDLGAGRRFPALGRGALREVRRPIRQPPHARARQGRQHEPRHGRDGRRGGGPEHRSPTSSQCSTRRRAAAALPDLDHRVVRRPGARTRAGAAVLLQLRRVRRRRGDG